MSDQVSTASVGETAEIKALCEEFKSLNPKALAIEIRLKFIKKKLAELSGGNPILSSGVSVTTYEKKGNIDYSLIKGIQQMTEDGSIEKYRKDSISVTMVKVVG